MQKEDDFIIGGNIPSNTTLPDGTECIARLYSFADVGTLIMGKHDNWANPFNFGFEVLAVIKDDELTGDEYYCYESAGKIFNLEIGMQPYYIGAMKYSPKKQIEFFKELSRDYKQPETGVINLSGLRLIMMQAFRVTVSTVQRGNGTYMDIKSIGKMLPVAKKKQVVAAASAQMTLNPCQLFFHHYDAINKEKITSAEQLVSTDMFKSLSRGRRNMVRKTNEFKAFADWERFSTPEVAAT